MKRADIASPEPFLVIELAVGEPVEIGPAGAGSRRMIPLGKGTVSGVVAGIVIPGGADWQTVRADGCLEIDAHYAIRTTEGAVIEIVSTGLRVAPAEVAARLAAGEPVDPSEYYFRTTMRFRTAAPELAYLNQRLAIARGERRPASVRLEEFEVR